MNFDRYKTQIVSKFNWRTEQNYAEIQFKKSSKGSNSYFSSGPKLYLSLFLSLCMSIVSINGERNNQFAKILKLTNNGIKKHRKITKHWYLIKTLIHPLKWLCLVINGNIRLLLKWRKHTKKILTNFNQSSIAFKNRQYFVTFKIRVCVFKRIQSLLIKLAVLSSFASQHSKDRSNKYHNGHKSNFPSFQKISFKILVP